MSALSASLTAAAAAATHVRRVLSIQSHVVHGCVGNRAAVLPLQLLGVETDVLNTVQYSNHVGYGSFAGEKLTGEQLFELMQGMHKNALLSPSHVLTGYMGSAEAIRSVLRAMPLLRASQPDFHFWCDPVLGDNGRLYVPRVLVDVYRDEVVPHAYALLPNQFEAEILSGVTIRTEADARQACSALHRRGVQLVVITSAQLEDPDGPAASELPPLTVILSQRPHGPRWRREYRVDVPQLPEHFAGTGDLLAALLLGWSSRAGTSPRSALQLALGGMQSVLYHTMRKHQVSAPSAEQATSEAAAAGAPSRRPLGLHLLDSLDDIRAPNLSEVSAPVRLDQPLRGVVFDLDGTLTLPGQLDFDRMRAVSGVPDGADIRATIEAMGAEERAAAWAAVAEIEESAFARLQLQPGLVSLIEALRSRGVRVAIATRNNARCVATFLQVAGLPPDTFAPVLTRDSGLPDKPHPAIALAASSAWGLQPEQCLMVGDSPDDVRCGRAAGMVTCCIMGALDSSAPTAESDFVIRALAELEVMLDDAVDAK